MSFSNLSVTIHNQTNVVYSEASWDFSTGIHRWKAAISASKENREKQLKNRMKEKANVKILIG